MHPFTDKIELSVSAIGENRLLPMIREWLGATMPEGPAGMGDDCAVLPLPKRRQLITVDPVIYGEHFNDSIDPELVGAKLLKRNLSDIASMGGIPTSAVLALAICPSLRRDWLERFYLGLASAARQWQVAICGGDIATHRKGLVATLTLLGEASGTRVLTRTGAEIGDHIYVTGVLGGSLGSGHHHSFMPRLDEGRWLNRNRLVKSMVDLSDGLGKDLRSLTPAEAKSDLFSQNVPIRTGCDLRAAFCDGEDYELLFTLDSQADIKRFENSWHRRFPNVALSRLGRFIPLTSDPLGDLATDTFHGFEHLR